MTYYCTTCNEYKDFEPAFKCNLKDHRVILRSKPNRRGQND